MSATPLALALQADDGTESTGYEPTEKDTLCGSDVPAHEEIQGTSQDRGAKLKKRTQLLEMAKYQCTGCEKAIIVDDLQPRADTFTVDDETRCFVYHLNCYTAGKEAGMLMSHRAKLQSMMRWRTAVPR